MILSSSVRQFMAGQDRSVGAPFARLETHFAKAELLVRLFYMLSAYKAYQMWEYLHFLTLQEPRLAPRWAIFWIESVPLKLVQVTDTLGLICFAFALLAFWKPGQRTFRAGYSLTLLFCLAIPPSIGGTNHGDHAWFWTSLCFVFLPVARNRTGKLIYCQTFAFAQALMLFFYTLAGFWKVRYGVASLVQGVEGNFSPRGLAITLADRIVQTNTEPLLGPFFIDNYLLAWPLFLGLIYAQFVAVAIVFRPSLHIPWGLILIAFHVGTFVLMEISFPNHVLLLLLLLVSSPFARTDWLQWGTLAKVPGAGLVLGIWHAGQRARPTATPVAA